MLADTALNLLRQERKAGCDSKADSGKQSVCIDIRPEAGRIVIHELAAKYDVVVQNM